MTLDQKENDVNLQLPPTYCLLSFQAVAYTQRGNRKRAQQYGWIEEIGIRVQEAKTATRSKVSKRDFWRSMKEFPMILDEYQSVWSKTPRRTPEIRKLSKSHKSSKVGSSLCSHQPQQREPIIHGNWVESPEGYQPSRGGSLAPKQRMPQRCHNHA